MVTVTSIAARGDLSQKGDPEGGRVTFVPLVAVWGGWRR